ncbi:MAG TPA: hypothetical protein VF323_12625 [Candidatus Limnocylindrales bacterium]
MRVRAFKLRLIAACFTVLWTVTAGLVLLGYRPGGPIDLLVGVAALVPIGIAAIGFAWPPAARNDGVFVATAWLGLLATLVLVPSIGGVVFQLTSAGAQTILPSWQAAYPWLLALATTSLFSGLGAARHLVGPLESRRRRLAIGTALGAAMTLGSGVLFGSAAIANEIGLRDRPVLFSRFGPADPALVVPACDDAILTPRTAHVELSLTADVDSHPVGWANIAGVRSGTSVRWSADVAADLALGRHGVLRTPTGAWRQGPSAGWVPVDPVTVDDQTLDLQVTRVALVGVQRTTAEDRGVEFIEGAKARHCRIAVDGPTALAAIPEMDWFTGSADLHRWRGELDFWVFGDREVGQVAMVVNGDAVEMGSAGLQATIRVTMIAVDRDQPVSISPP